MSDIMVIGLGSMGKRRIRLLKKIRPDIDICAVDIDSRRREFAAKEYGVSVYESLDKAIAIEKPIAAVISTAPLSHAELIHTCLQAGLHVFTELNLVNDSYEENMSLAEEKDKVLFLSSTPLYREEPKYIISRAKNSVKPLNYRYHVGQYLPDWHPWESYKDFFVGDTRTNGCREILAIELSWLIAAFGPIQDIQVMRNRCTELAIAYDDSYMVQLRHAGGHMGSLCVDVVSRKAVRLFELYGEEIHITWDGTPDSLCEWDIAKKTGIPVNLYGHAEHQEGYAAFILENAYSAELEAYLEAIEKGIEPIYGFKEDMETIHWIERIEGK